ncbi:MAG: ARMT1-like domain-containing protein [Candidatus Methanoplasma sp.]|nr:ARMT1-like domain-containing protein [Candidatus Methanoplasma sp.]
MTEGMNVSPDCVPCLMRRVLFQSRLPANGKDAESVEAGLKEYARIFSWGMNSADCATQVHGKAYGALGVRDPYAEIKERADEAAARHMDRAGSFVAGSADRFAAAARISIIGNVMDFGSGISIDDPDDFDAWFDELLGQGVDSDQTPELKALAESADTVLYLFDNCGESQFDKFLIRELRSMGKRVIGVVKGEPILNDVTREDAERIGLDKELDGILDTGGFAIGIDMRIIGPELRGEMRRGTVIVAKGMANLEALSDERLNVPIAYLLRAKCTPVADLLGVAKGANVVRIQHAGDALRPTTPAGPAAFRDPC